MTTHSQRQPATRPPAAQRVTQERTQARCQQGRHTLSNTIRPAEQVCRRCGLVLYCPTCLTRAHLPLSSAERAYPLPCAAHQEVSE